MTFIAQGAILRSKCSWYEKGEKSTKFFLNLEKQRKNKTHVKKILDNNTEISDQTEILKKLNAFYSNLYSSKPLVTEQECMDYLSEINTPYLTVDQANLCGGKVTVREGLRILQQMPNDKTPGNDGSTKEFMLCFYVVLAELLIDSLNYSFEVGELSSSQKLAMITLIEKKDKDKRLTKNWRPISLLNVDTKILSKALPSRLKSVIGFLVTSYQTAYVPGRFIGESVRLISDILEYTDNAEIPCYMLSVDIEKHLILLVILF